MDFRLKELEPLPVHDVICIGFNPCSNGLSAQRCLGHGGHRPQFLVSILVLMDFRLKDALAGGEGAPGFCFNPCSNGLSAQSIGHGAIHCVGDAFQSLF